MTTVPAQSAVFPSVEVAKCPFPFLDAVREETPVYEVPTRPGEYVVSRYEDIRYVLKHPELFSSAAKTQDVGMGLQGVPPMTILTDPPHHTVQRRLISGPFAPARVQDRAGMITAVVDRLIDGFVDDGECDFASAFATPLPVYVTANIFGLPDEDYDMLRVWGEIEGAGTRYRDEAVQAHQRDNKVKMTEYLTKVLLERHKSPGDDVLSEIIGLQIERDGEFDLPYLLSEAALLVSGGTVTTAHAIASAMMLLLQHPEQMAAVRADHTKLRVMFEESVRMESPVQWQARRCVADTQIAGIAIPEGSSVIWAIQAANRDPRAFECPENFDIARSNVKAHLAFGFGAHTCFGAPLARLEAEIGFGRLFDRLSDIDLAPADQEFEPIDSVTFRGPRQVLIRFKKA